MTSQAVAGDRHAPSGAAPDGGDRVRTTGRLSGQAILPLWAALPAAVVAGVAMDAAFPSLGWWPLAFAAVTLSLVTLVGRSMWGAVLVGAVYGASFAFPHLSWAAEFLGEHPMSWVPWLAFATAQSLFLGASPRRSRWPTGGCRAAATPGRCDWWPCRRWWPVPGRSGSWSWAAGPTAGFRGGASG